MKQKIMTRSYVFALVYMFKVCLFISKYQFFKFNPFQPSSINFIHHIKNYTNFFQFQTILTHFNRKNIKFKQLISISTNFIHFPTHIFRRKEQDLNHCGNFRNLLENCVTKEFGGICVNVLGQQRIINNCSFSLLPCQQMHGRSLPLHTLFHDMLKY